jgi:hypothetical protein
MRTTLLMCLVIPACGGLVACGGIGDLRTLNFVADSAEPERKGEAIRRIDYVGNELLQWEKRPLPTLTDCTAAPASISCSSYTAR